jgi:hypothetical protein
MMSFDVITEKLIFIQKLYSFFPSKDHHRLHDSTKGLGTIISNDQGQGHNWTKP